MTNGEKIQTILDIDRDCTEVHGENGTMTFTVTQDFWNAEYKEPTIRNCFGCKYSKDNHNSGTEECHLCMWENQYTPTTKNDLEIVCKYTDEEISKAFIEDVEAVKDQLPKGQQMKFPDTFDEFAKDYGFKDEDEIYTNGSELIPVFRVKQWLAHMSTIKNDLGIDSISRKEVLQMIDNIREAGGFIGYNTYSEAFDQVCNMPSVPRWTPVSSEGFPKKKDGYFVSVKKGYVTTALWCGIAEYWHNVIAWMPFPKPYKTESEEVEKCAENMTYREPIYNLNQAKSVPYRKATFSKVNELPNELEGQESVLDKHKAESER